MAPDTRNVDKPPQQFEFINNNPSASSKLNSTRVRRKAMLTHIADKRWEAMAKLEVDTSDPASQAETLQATFESIQGSFLRFRHCKRQPSASMRSTNSTAKSSASSHTVGRSIRKGSPKSSMKARSRKSLPAIRQQEDEKESNDGPFTDLSISDWPVSDTSASLSMLITYKPMSDDRTTTSSSSTSLYTIESISETIVSPVTMLSASRTDPFDVMPISLDDEDKELFDFYAQTMPQCSYGLQQRRPKAHNWYRDVFILEARKGAVTFQNTVLVHAANTKAWVEGLTETHLTLKHRERATRLLSDHYQKNPFDTSDAIITATMSAAALEDFDPRLERRPIAWLHWAAAMHKVRQRGGPAVVQDIPSLRKLINWQDYILSGYDGRGSSFYFTPDAILETTSWQARRAYGQQEIAQQCEEFIIFLKCVDQLSYVTGSQFDNPLVRHSQPLRFSAFAPGRPLHVLLASSNKERYTDTGQLKQIISRLGALMTINIAIWEYRHDTSYSEKFLQELIENIVNNELHKNVSVEALLQILLSGNEDPELQHFERPWLVGRLLKVSKRLSRQTWEWLNDFLLSCLTLSRDPGQPLQIPDREEALRSEILSAPLVSYKLPLMLE